MVTRGLAVLLLWPLLILCSCGGQSDPELRAGSAPPRIESRPGATPLQGGVPLLVRLFDAGSYSDQAIVRWEWNHGGGWVDCTATEGETWQTFTQAGAAVVQLRVTNAGGKKSIGMLRLRLDPKFNAAPIAVAGGGPLSGTAPLAVAFTPAGSYDPDGALTQWEWDFGSGFVDFTSSQGVADHVFTAAGEHACTLRVTDNDGATATAVVTVAIDAAPNQGPTALAGADPANGTAPLVVNFSPAGSSDPDGTLVKWEWDFGAGFSDFTPSAGETAHTFTDPGDYPCTLRVTDDDGAEATAAVSVTVAPAGWAHTYGMAQLDEAYATVVDTSGNVYVAGKHAFNPGTGEQRMLLLARYSPEGALQWVKTFSGSGRTSFVDTTVNGMALDPVSGGVVVLATSNELSVGGTDFVLAKFGPTGTTWWSRSWGGSGNETASGVSVDPSGFIYATGTSTGFGGGSEVALVKYNAWGDLHWQRLWGTALAERGQDVAADADGVYVLADSAELGAGRTDPVLLRYTSNGALVWSRGYQGNVAARSLARDGASLLLGGNTHAAGGAAPRNLLAARVDLAGELLWLAAWGNGAMLGRDVVANAAGVYVAGSATVSGNSRCVVARFDGDGTFGAAGLWSSNSTTAQGFGLALDATGMLHVAGAAPNMQGSYGAATGSEVAATLTPFAPTATSRTPGGASAWVFGLEDPPAGVADSGGGGGDMLILKGFQL